MNRLRSAARMVLRICPLAFCLLGTTGGAWANCETVLAGKSFGIRLQDPVASYSTKPGTHVRAFLIQSPECNGWPVFPAGLEVDGEVVAARKVGLGLIHDTAFIEVRFNRIVSANGA